MRGQQTSFVCLQLNSLLLTFSFHLAVSTKKLSVRCDIFTPDVRKTSVNYAYHTYKITAISSYLMSPKKGYFNSIDANEKYICRNRFLQTMSMLQL